jgi:hypothetical protein
MRRPDLVSDCRSCDALCCVATSFDASEDFAISKAAGAACPHLAVDRRCTIHAALAERGFLGCAIYDCYGAGPKITRAFDGDCCSQRQRNAAFMAMRIVHELLWQLLEASRLCPASQVALGAELASEVAALEALAQAPTSLDAMGLEPHEAHARALLRRLGHVLRGRSGAALPILQARESAPRTESGCHSPDPH